MRVRLDNQKIFIVIRFNLVNEIGFKTIPEILGVLKYLDIF
jgi:hypothetical protein